LQGLSVPRSKTARILALTTVSVGGGFGDAVGGTPFGDDVAARVVAPGFPAGGVAHGGAPTDGIGGGESGRATTDGGAVIGDGDGGS
jgi:hypothetical protein